MAKSKMVRVVIHGDKGLTVYRTKAVEWATLAEVPSVIFYTEDTANGWEVVPLANIHVITAE